MTTYFISGHLDITPEEFKAHYEPVLLSLLGNPIPPKFVVGDAPGADTIAQNLIFQYCRTMVVRWDFQMTVYHMFWEPRNNPGVYPHVGGFWTDEGRDAAMTAASDQDIAWIRPGKESSGTARNLKRRASKIAAFQKAGREVSKIASFQKAKGI